MFVDADEEFKELLTYIKDQLKDKVCLCVRVRLCFGRRKYAWGIFVDTDEFMESVYVSFFFKVDHALFFATVIYGDI